MKEIKFSKSTKKMAMKQGAFSILMSTSILLGVIGLFLRGKTGVGIIFSFITGISVIFSISFIRKIRMLETMTYINLHKDRIQINNISSKVRTIMFNDITKVDILISYINIIAKGKVYKIYIPNMEKEDGEEVKKILIRYNKA